MDKMFDSLDCHHGTKNEGENQQARQNETGHRGLYGPSLQVAAGKSIRVARRKRLATLRAPALRQTFQNVAATQACHGRYV